MPGSGVSYCSPGSQVKWPTSRISPEDLFSRAQDAFSNAYAPYSGFKVGAAILTSKDEIISGCNVENAVLSLTVCAERNAMTTLIQTGGGQPLAIAVACANGRECLPCGSCRQFLMEFNPRMLVVAGSKGNLLIHVLSDLLPRPFLLE